jgi:DNA-directed RNA polymerase specialized sigma24 family protein
MGTTPVDDLLKHYVECNDADRAEALLGDLIVEHAHPGIRKVVRYKLAFQGQWESQDIEDVAGEVVLELIGRLRAMRTGGPAEAIGSFAGYTAVAAYHACNEYLRRKYPNRHRLKTRLRYLLSNEKKFAIWEGPSGDWICGLDKWQRDAVVPAPTEVVSRWRDVLSEVPRGQNAMRPADLLGRIFSSFHGPVLFDELVGIVGYFWGVDDPAPAPEKSAREVQSNDFDPGVRLELRQWLTQLWAEIRELPRAQRVALLLNLRAGDTAPAVTLLPITGVASIRLIGEALELPPEDFAGLWNSLPLEDLAIAELLGITRQQVINLRKSARERLMRRIGGKYRLS